jgi:hypothetical protein
LHFAIQKLHWSPFQIEEWLDADQSVKAFYYASTELKVKHDSEETKKLERNAKKGKR